MRRVIALLSILILATLPAFAQNDVNSRFEFSSSLADLDGRFTLEAEGEAAIGDLGERSVLWLRNLAHLDTPESMRTALRYDQSFFISVEFYVPSDSLSADVPNHTRYLFGNKDWGYDQPGYTARFGMDEGNVSVDFNLGFGDGRELARILFDVSTDRWHYVWMAFDFELEQVTFGLNSQQETVSLKEDINGRAIDPSALLATLEPYAPRFGGAHPQGEPVEFLPESRLDPNETYQFHHTTLALDNIQVSSPRPVGNADRVTNSIQALHADISANTLSESERAQLQATIRDNLNGIDPTLIIPSVRSFVDAYAAVNGPIYDKHGGELRHDSFDALTRSYLDVMLWMMSDGLRLETVALAEGLVFEEHENWPGVVPAQAERVENASVDMNVTYIAPEGYLFTAMDYNPAVPLKSALYRPTGFYAPPGELVTISVPPSLVGSGAHIRIGAHTEDHRQLATSNRFPLIYVDYPIDAETIQVVSPLGGGLYLLVPIDTELGWVPFTFSGAVRSPYYSYRTDRVTSDAEWATQRSYLAPWADFESDKYQFSAPTDQIADFTEADTLMARWDRAMDIMQHMFGRPMERARPEGWVLDTKSPALGSYPGGYPVFPGLWAAYQGDLTRGPYSPFGLTDARVWEQTWGGEFVILIHEMGHHHLPFTLEHETESIVNLPAAGVLNYVMGVPLDDALKYSSFQRLDRLGAAIDWMAMDNFRSGGSMREDQLRYQDRGIAKYIDLVDIFGSWDVMYDVYRPYLERDIARGGPEWVGQQTMYRDDFLLTGSEALGCSLAPLFEFWGIVPSAKGDLELRGYTPCDGMRERIEFYLENAPRTAEEAWEFYRLNGLPGTNGLESWIWEPLTQRFSTREGQQIRDRGLEILNKYFDVTADSAPSMPVLSPDGFSAPSGSSDPVTFSWSAASDPEGRALTYSWRLYDVETGDLLVYRTAVSGTQVEISASEMADALSRFDGASRQRLLAEQVTTSDLYTVVSSEPKYLLYQDGVAVGGSPNILPGPDEYSVNEDEMLTVPVATGLLANDTDADGDALVVSLTSEPQWGEVELQSDGSFTYRPNEHFNGDDVFQYKVSDGDNAFDHVSVSISVDAVPDPPSEPGFEVYIDLLELSGLPSDTFDLAFDAEDPDGDLLTWTYELYYAGQLLLQRDTGDTPTFSIRYDDFYALLEQNGLLNSDRIELYDRVVVSDGTFTVPGYPHNLVVQIGQFVGVDQGDELPREVTLAANYPNPFNPTTTLRFALPQAGQARLLIYDLLGRQIATVQDSWLSAGWHQIQFDASALSSGMYLQVLEVAGERRTRMLTLLK